MSSWVFIVMLSGFIERVFQKAIFTLGLQELFRRKSPLWDTACKKECSGGGLTYFITPDNNNTCITDQVFSGPLRDWKQILKLKYLNYISWLQYTLTFLFLTFPLLSIDLVLIHHLFVNSLPYSFLYFNIDFILPSLLEPFVEEARSYINNKTQGQ